MAEELFTNNAATTLAANINSSVTTATLAAGTGALFPNPGPNQFFRATLFASSSVTGVPNEVVFVTGRSGDTVTIVRGQEGTSPAAWAAGDNFDNQLTAGAIANFAQQPDVQAQAGNFAVDTGTANAAAITLTPAPPTPLVAGLTVRVQKVAAANTGATTLSVNSGGPIAITYEGAALPAGMLPASLIFTAVYDGSAWELQGPPGVVNPNGAAGGDLSGFYPNPAVAANAVTNAKLAKAAPATVVGVPVGAANPSNRQDLNGAQLLAILGGFPWALVNNQQASGTGSGETLSATAWTKRTLNTILYNGITGLTLSGGVVGLANAGVYVAFALAASQASGNVTNYTHTTRLHDDNSGLTVSVGLVNGYAGASNVAVVMASLLGAFTLSAAGAVHLDSWVSTGCNGGNAIPSGEFDVYSSLVLAKIA